jgi:hypothetical protein
MTLHDTIALSFIRCLIHPFVESKPVEYKSGLKKAQRILISCPAGEKGDLYGKSIEDFVALFKGKKVSVILPNRKVGMISAEKGPLDRSPGAIKFRLFRILKSRFILGLQTKKPDVLIDLDPNFNLLNIYLCRFLQTSLRIAFRKPQSHPFYNLQFDSDSDLSYPERREKLYQFLQLLLK